MRILRHRLPFTSLVIGLVVTPIAACGGTVVERDIVCPPDDVCTPREGGDTGSAGNDTGSPTPPDEDAGAPDSRTPTDDATPPQDGADASTPVSSADVEVLTYRVVDAEMSAILASLVLVSDTPSNTLHVYDPVAKTDRVVALPTAPVAVSVDKSGLFAAVAYDAHVSWIDLKAGTIRATRDLSSDAFDVALTTEGAAYVVPRTDQWVSLHGVDLTTCKETLWGWELYASSHVQLHPSEKAVFVADQGLSPSDVQRCNVSDATNPTGCTDAMGAESWGTYDYCGNLWMSADGQRIYTACGVTLRVPGALETDVCTYGGSLDGVTSIRHLFEATTAKEVATVASVNTDPIYGDDPNGDTFVSVNETDFLGFKKKYDLPQFPLPAGKTVVAHGRFVFGTAALDALYVVVQADAASGALQDFGVATIKP